MEQVHQGGRLGRDDLRAIASGRRSQDIDDMEFFETLAHRRCVVMPPYVYHIDDAGHLEQVTPVRYTSDYHLDKASILLGVMEKLERAEGRRRGRSDRWHA